MITLIGIKIGMTRIFNKKNVSLPITIIKIYNNIIVLKQNIHNKKKILITLEKHYKKHINKSVKCFLNKRNIKLGIGGMWSLPYVKNIHKHIGQKLNISLLNNLKKVDITGYSKGKGYAGTIKRWNFKSQDKSHGNSLSHRAPGSIGQNQSPGRVFKGKKMSGHMGNKKRTVQNLNIINIYSKKKLLLIKGSVPGFINSFLYVKSSIKCK